jgi:hypothetical protein
MLDSYKERIPIIVCADLAYVWSLDSRRNGDGGCSIFVLTWAIESPFFSAAIIAAVLLTIVSPVLMRIASIEFGVRTSLFKLPILNSLMPSTEALELRGLMIILIE